jgi:hypothetical protein
MTHATEDPKDVRTKTRIRVWGCGDSKNMSKVRVLKKTYVRPKTYVYVFLGCLRGHAIVRTDCSLLTSLTLTSVGRNVCSSHVARRTGMNFWWHDVASRNGVPPTVRSLHTTNRTGYST